MSIVSCYPKDKYPFAQELITNARKIVANGKGILAADESVNTIGKHLTNIGVENTAENRREWREIMFSSEGKWEEYIGGVILFEEQLYQKTENGKDLIDYLKEKDIVIGIKVDKGVKPLLGTEGETVTIGIDDLDTRCKKFYERGARFAKWRAVLTINGSSPSENSILQNAYTLARYASICQENGLVPIIEPEILMDGDHDIYTAAKITRRVLAATYYQCHLQNVLLEGTLLKPNMVLPGYKFPNREKISTEEIGRTTVAVLRDTVPPSVAGIVFLSGGQSEEEATKNLNSCNSTGELLPWKISFSFGRALQKSGITAWGGKKENVKNAQSAWLVRAKSNWEASQGKYGGNSSSSGSSNQSLHVENYTY